MLNSSRCRVVQLFLVAVTLWLWVGGFLGTIAPSFSLVPLRPTKFGGWSQLELHAQVETLSRRSQQTNSAFSQIAVSCGVGGLFLSLAFVSGTSHRFRRAQPKLLVRDSKGHPNVMTLSAVPDAVAVSSIFENFDAPELAAQLKAWTEAIAAETMKGTGHTFDLWPAAWALDAPVIDPNVKYILGVDGKPLIDAMSNKPISDDWWNGFIGFQADAIKNLDAQLRAAGVKEAFGWTIVLYTALIKLLFYPIQQSQVKSTAMMQLLQPKVKEIQERYKDDPQTMQQLMGNLYTTMDVNPLGGCLPLFLQLPLFWSLYGVWRRLPAEKFPHYDESWLWVPSLARPNPDFQLKLDWVFDFVDGAPKIGWDDYRAFWVFPLILMAATLVSQQQTKPAPTAAKDDTTQLLTTVLPAVSLYFIGTLSLELPQAVSVYYASNTALTLAQTALVKNGLRSEIPGYEEFERTGKFPDDAFESMRQAALPQPTTIHEASLQGNVEALDTLFEESGGDMQSLNAWDEKSIPPLGYAVATGNLNAIRWFVAKGASLEVKDGQQNTLLHYAAGYGHLDALKEILQAGSGKWPNDEWKEWRNERDQDVFKAAMVNRKGLVMDYLTETYGILPPKPPTPVTKAEPTNAASDQARAALLAAANGGPAPMSPEEVQKLTSSPEGMQDLVSKLKGNPEALEQAKAMMKNAPPELLSQITGGQVSADEAAKTLGRLQEMSAEDIIDVVTTEGKAKAPAEVSEPAGPARVVD